jgi:hypothetical protein
MSNYQAKDLFQLQAELIDLKVDMAASRASDRVIEHISGLRKEIHVELHGIKGEIGEVKKRLSSLENRTTAVETKLGMVNDTQKEFRSKFIEYSFKAMWIILPTVGLYAVTQLYSIFK